MNRNVLKTVYLGATIVGALIPMFFFAQFFDAEQGIAVQSFVAALFVNGATSGFTADLLISSFVFWIFMFSRKPTGPGPWPFILLNLAIGLSCALPAYLFFSQRKVIGSP